ncbi:MAG: bifunctional [glutamate--ammonia ligase]-adenylyl-L-tyrosine phosphorylase/[glutamate--ammonia-ligase] adenylyltransferase, partial [Candidatus Hydrogenedentota bacterium]
CINPRTERALMAAMPRYTEMLVAIFDQSHYLTDIVCRNPEFVSWLWEEASLDEAVFRGQQEEALRRQIAAFDNFASRAASMRRFKRREFLRVAVRDIFVHSPLRSLVEDMSNLADAMVAVAYECAYTEVSARYGVPQVEHGEEKAAFSVLAMGKLAGRELNFSSDIDLIFLYSHDGQTSGGASGSTTNADFFRRVGERIIKMLHEQTSEGNVFRVDMRLRPYGRAGALAISIDSAIAYYERAGQAWERQALIKTRPIAGDAALGEEFTERTRPFTYPRYFDDETLEDIRNTKQQMEARVDDRGETKREVKLGRGGIRDIEFTVQVLQLLNGGRTPELRTPNTLDAIAALGEYGILRPLDAAALKSNYTFLRQVEHRLQIEGSQQRHTLPKEPEELDYFARRMGYANSDSFMADYRDRTEETRDILEGFLAAKGAGTLWINDLVNPHSDGRHGIARLQQCGFRDPLKARQEFLALSVGSENHTNTLRVRQTFANIAPVLIESLGELSDPDTALLRLTRLLANLRAPGAIYDILNTDPALCRQLTRLIANSVFLTEILMRDPGLFDVIGVRSALEASASTDLLRERLEDLCTAYDREAGPYRFVSGEMLRIGTRDLFEFADVQEVGAELTNVAEVCLQFVLEQARESVVKRYGRSNGAFGVLGMGKLGGRELGYGSDLDLVFVYEEEPSGEFEIAPVEYFTAVASKLLRTLKEPTRYGTLYDVDARLRPDGNKGVLVVTPSRLRDYYLNEAQAWERLALVKARFVAGDPEFGRAIDEVVRNLAFERALTAEELENIEEIRSRIVAQASRYDLKREEGGIAELEFTLRLQQLACGQDYPEVRRTDALGALDALTGVGAFNPEDAAKLREAYLFLRRLENRVRMMHGRSGSRIPESPEEQTDLAKRLHIDEDLVQRTNSRKADVHAIYQKVFQSLRAQV